MKNMINTLKNTRNIIKGSQKNKANKIKTIKTNRIQTIEDTGF
jgi:hypothetical protein